MYNHVILVLLRLCPEQVIWNAGMKERLVDYLATDLEPFVLSRSADPLTPYVYSTKSPLAYPELAGKPVVLLGRSVSSITCTRWLFSSSQIDSESDSGN